jgi:hypothetical protein
MNSEAYETAREVHTVAIRAYNVALAAYRALEINDAEFFAARAIKVAADKAFDVAFEIEVSRQEVAEEVIEETNEAQIAMFA